MPISSAIKGLQSIKSMQNVVKSGIPQKEDSQFIKLYMLEKERNRLKSEETRILLRLEFIQGRLKEIQEFYDEKAEEMQHNEEEKTDQTNSGWKTMSMDY